MESNIIIHRCLLLFLAIAYFLPLNCTTQLPNSASISPDGTKEVWLTVFVHGIISIKPHTTLLNFPRFLTDNVIDSPYGQTVEMIRQDPFFYQNQTIQTLGLLPIDLSNFQKGATASTMARIFDKINQINAPHDTLNFYYTYGWSGLLSKLARYYDAKLFLDSLEKEVARFRAMGIEPKIRLIGYSHGGTIILKLALVKQKESLNPSFAINETYLFGTPIQFDTDYLIADPLFLKVYNMFSRSDRAQKLDFFSSGHFFSDQIFSSHFGFEELPSKLTQVEIRMIRKAGESCLPLHQTDAQLPLLFNGKRCSRKIRNVSPGHSELWFFGWTPLNYRPTFLLYPLPVAAFATFITNAIKPFEHTFTPERPVVVTIDPRRNSFIVNNNTWRCPIIEKLSFVGVNTLIALQQEALLYKPDPNYYNYDAFNKHIEQAHTKAMALLKEKKCALKRKCSHQTIVCK